MEQIDKKNDWVYGYIIVFTFNLVMSCCLTFVAKGDYKTFISYFVWFCISSLTYRLIKEIWNNSKRT